MTDIDAPGVLPIWTPVAWLAGFMKGATKHGYTKNMKALGLVVSEKKIFYDISIVCLWELMTRGCSQIRPQVHNWQDLSRVPLNIITYQIYKL